jgi:carbamoylphosphate synthase large subunit
MKIAIIGASSGQFKLCVKAKQKGVESIGFAWLQGAICKEYVDKFYPISIMDMDKIVDICKKEKVNGVASNASEITAEVTAYVAERLDLHCTPYKTILQIKDKAYVRKISNNIKGLSAVTYKECHDDSTPIFPGIIKPVIGSAKQGVSFVSNRDEYEKAVAEARKISKRVLFETYIEGKEVSVETLSYEGNHYIIQITDKKTTGYPHFVELEHHQPSSLPKNIINRITAIIPLLLSKVGYTNGAAHTELKIDKEGNIFLIEINPRGGGDEISNQLVELSTGYDYVGGMIDIALGIFNEPIIRNRHYAGIYFLCKQTEAYLDFFKQASGKNWLIENNIHDYCLNNATSNYDRNGYLIYQSDEKIIP